MDKEEAARRLIGNPEFHNLLEIKRIDRANARLAVKILIVAGVVVLIMLILEWLV